MYKPKNQEKQQPSEQVGGVILNFAQTRKTEAQARLLEFIRSPINWMRQNEPIRKAILLETLEFLRPNISTEYEHKIETWRKPR
jgi:hypothetical protein